MSHYTATPPTFAVERARASKLQSLSDYVSAATSALDTFTTTLTNINVGTTGTTTALYKQLGKRITGSVVLAFAGTGMSIGTAPSITLPVAPHARYISASALGLSVSDKDALLADTGTGNWEAKLMVTSGSTATIFYHTEAGGGGLTQISSGVPYTVAATDVWRLSFAYDAA